ncbi:unnamed protein product [Cyprideis torosa]|uniref:Alpha-1,3-mannosyl-glycoprotein 4-beta-N-acetylglucosaminyltransferase A n=1 Tax=Cyprideis torosa TaxID=163714 RepID=A0A7R8WJ30_9CRUS|nr:unnamed protein product [Cyprideis torosa]CAG0901513.1 unnamed protein product [Cyprideis torosa]
MSRFKVTRWSSIRPKRICSYLSLLLIGVLLINSIRMVSQVIPNNDQLIQTAADLENETSQRIAFLMSQLHSAKMSERNLKEDLYTILQKMPGFSQLRGKGSLFGLGPLRPPTIYQFLPHLLNSPNSLQPAFLFSKNRADVSVVLGIPTVRRQVQSYLVHTLENLIQNMNPAEREDTLIVVMIGEINAPAVEAVYGEIAENFRDHLDSGLIDVIAPSPGFYPNMSSLPVTLDDPRPRFEWRTKQNLDFAFLMMYASQKGTYYVQLEDDIIATKDFVTTMKRSALSTVKRHPNWIVLEFCTLGFVGKLFHAKAVQRFAAFILIFFQLKPVDWLLPNFMESSVCALDATPKVCRKARSEVWITFKPSLFQHVGMHSSLKGKIQKLKDKNFKSTRFTPHTNNPPVRFLHTDIKSHKTYTLERAYSGKSFFWGLEPQAGDEIIFEFADKVNLTKYLIRTGNDEHPQDLLLNTTVEVLPAASATVSHSTGGNSTQSTKAADEPYVVIGSTDHRGLAEGRVPNSVNPIAKLRLKVHQRSHKWAIISEILFVS